MRNHVVGWLPVLGLVLAVDVHAEHPTPDQTLRRWDGSRLVVRPKELSPRMGVWEWVTPGNGPKTYEIPTRECVAWGADGDWPERGGVFLIDGSVLAGELLQLGPDEIQVRHRLLGVVSIARTLVSGILVQPPGEPLARDQLAARLALQQPARYQSAGSASRRLERDEIGEAVELLNGDVLNGVVNGAPVAQGGMLTSLLVGKPPVESRLDQVVAIRLQPTMVWPLTAGAGYWFGFRDGSRLLVRDWESTPMGNRIRLAAGITVTLPDGVWLEQLVSFRPVIVSSSGPVVFVSDLRVVGYRHVPFLSIPWNLGLDGSSRGGALRYRGNVVAKGLGMHATSRAAFDVPAGRWLLEGELAVDDSAGDCGGVVYRVYGQGESNDWRTLYESPLVRGGDAAISLRVDLQGAARVALVVDAAERGDSRDDANWLWLRLVRADGGSAVVGEN